MNVLTLLFGLSRRVTRREYVTWGFPLAALKFALDSAIVYAGTHKLWSPLGYLVPSLALRGSAIGDAPQAMHAGLVLAALPFLWIGLTMSVRRAADADRSPWLGVLFLVPLVNYIVIAILALSPSRAEASWAPPQSIAPYRASARKPKPAPEDAALPHAVRSALLGVLASLAVGLGMLWIAVYGLGAYGAALFFATPFTMGAVSASIYNHRRPQPLFSTLGLAVLGTVLTGSICLLFALEGILCLLMAFPIAAVVSVVGATVAWGICANHHQRLSPAMLVALPILAIGEAQVAEPTLRDVTTAITIDAPPDAVWPNVIGFSELPPPPEWFFRLGIAHPVRARIEGSGVGAVRHCEFSTGPFVEPITVWEPGKRLAFDVTAQPPSMTEWSPYATIHAPHLEDYMVSRGGEFRLTRLPGDRTRLEGTTHYTLAIYPEVYWVNHAEVLLHAIHRRVLEHIKRISEAPSAG